MTSSRIGAKQSDSPSRPVVLFDDEVAERLRVSKSTLRRWRANGEGPTCWGKIGRQVAYNLESLLCWERAQTDGENRTGYPAKTRAMGIPLHGQRGAAHNPNRFRGHRTKSVGRETGDARTQSEGCSKRDSSGTAGSVQ